MEDMGKLIIFLGITLVIIGLVLTFLPSIPKLPGDIYIKKDHFTFYFPIVTSIIISIILTIIMTFLHRR